MSSSILSGLSASANSPQIIAQSAQLGQGGLLAKGAVVAPSATLNSLLITGVPGGASPAEVQFQNAPLTPLLPQRYDFLNASVNNGGEFEGQLQVFTYNNGTFVAKLVDSQVPPRGAGAITGAQAIWGLTAPSQSGTATIPGGAATTALIANTAITAGSVIMVSGVGAINTTGALSVSLSVGNGFTITSAANATGDKTVAYFIVKY